MNTFGRIFRVSIFGESHGESVGVLIDGCPPGLKYNIDDMQALLDRRKPGAKGTTKRVEADTAQIKSGVLNGYTTGQPIIIEFANKNVRSEDYDKIKNIARPGHADYTSSVKYKGFNDTRGGGSFSGRLTAGLVAAGYFAKLIVPDAEINAQIIEIGGETNYDAILDNAVREGDSLGGVIECRVNGLEIGLGEPYFDSVESVISHIVFSVPAIKGIEFGSGFASAKMRGSEHNDEIIDKFGRTKTNNAGGINGGITNGNELVFRVAVKPTSSIGKVQKTINLESGESENIQITGRHDSCIALRIPVIIECVTAIALADLSLMKKVFA